MATESRLIARAFAVSDPASLAVFRILLGGILAVAPLRFWANGWIEQLYIEPSYHFSYISLPVLSPLPGWGMYGLFAALALLGTCLCLGAACRLSAFLYFIAFTYVELLDKATYLNHYYFVSLMTLLLSFIDSGKIWSFDAWRRARAQAAARATGTATALPAAGVPALAHFTLRFQVAIVYFFAGLAKLNADWLVSGEPLATWLGAFADLPIVGTWLAQPLVAQLMSGAGALFDLGAPLGLGLSRTRTVYFVLVVTFHISTWLLFPIGIFPWVMIVSATLFFSPSWPRDPWRLLSRRVQTASASTRTRQHEGALRCAEQDQLPRRTNLRSALAMAIVALYCFLQLAVPLRFLAYNGDVNWTERGFRFAWRVMLVEKAGLVEYRIVSDNAHGEQKTERVFPHELLSELQYRMMRTQPDMIAQFAHELARRARTRQRKDHSGQLNWQPRIYADAWVAKNGKPAARIICPDVDLAAGEPTSDAWLTSTPTSRCPAQEK